VLRSLLLVLTSLAALGSFAMGDALADPGGVPRDDRIDLLSPQTAQALWHYRGGDDPRYAAPDFDDRHWPIVRGFGLSQRLGIDEPVIWYRWQTVVNPREGQRIGVSLTALGAWELFVNGELVGKDGVIGKKAGTFRAHVFDVHDAVPTSGGMDVAVRLWAPKQIYPGGGGISNLALGDVEALELLGRSTSYERESASRPLFVVALFSILVGLVHLLLAARRRDPDYGWFGLATFLLGTQVVSNQSLWNGWVAPFPGYVLSSLGAGAAAFAGLLQYHGRFFRADRRVAHVLSLLLLARVVYVLPMFGQTEPSWILTAISVPAVLWVLFTLVRGLGTGTPGARWVVAGIVSMTIWPIESTLRVNHLVPTWWEELGLGWWFLAGSLLGMLFFQIVALAERFASTFEELEATQAATRRFVPFEFLQRIGRTNVRDVEKGDVTRTEMTILFLDVRGFTTIAERSGPEKTFQFVNELWGHMEPPLRDNGGFVHQFLGDGLLALFPSPDGAVQAAIDLVASLATFDSRALVGEAIEAGIGLHTGTVMLGTIGGRDHLAAGVVADAVNLASRVEGLTKVYGARVLLTDATRDRLIDRGGFELREVDRVVAKGRTEPISLFEVIGAETAEVRARRKTDLDAFGIGLGHYRQGAFREAIAALTSLREDPAARVLVDRCRRLLDAPPHGWTGVWRMDSK
jgi:class 3 adenylate cyclase